MKIRNQGWKYALLFVLAFGVSGCAARKEVYTAGVQMQETVGVSDIQESPDVQKKPDASAVQELSDTPERAATAEEVSPDANEKAKSETPPAGEPESEGYVYICGAVNCPGVYPVHEGMRVFEALALAGGFSQDADREWLNQAEIVQDGQRLYVYTQEETRLIREDGQENGQVLWPENAGSEGIGRTGNGGSAGDDAAGSDGQKVNLNTADREQLKTLPGIGDAKADAILQYREEHGPFGAIEEIQNISGIKDGVFSKIKDLITV